MEQSLVKARRLQKLEEAGCFLPRKGLQIILDKLFRMNKSGSSRDVVPETSEVETLRKHLSRGRVYKFADFIRVQAKGICDRIEDGNIVLKFVKCSWTVGHGISTLQDLRKKLCEKDMVSLCLSVLVLGRQKR